MLAERTGLARSVLDVSMRLVSYGRAFDPKQRVQKLRAALAAAREGGASHLVLSGDLTELGTPEQFEAFAEALFDERVDPDRVTLLPGNHDAYSRPDAWSRALEGPLAAFRGSSAPPSSTDARSLRDGAVVERDGVTLLPIDVACHQHFTRATGALEAAEADALERRVTAVAGRGRPVVIVLHHSPLPHTPRAWQWLHGLRGGERVRDLLARFPDVSVLHGHLHYEVTLPFGDGGARIFGATAVVDDALGAPRVRFYDVRGASLLPVDAAAAADRPSGRAIAA
jgi:3',5'-cyclic AMP phosphodiesterase CpdA